MKIAVQQSSKEYIAGIKERLDSPFLWGQERFTGFCIGSIFSVGYYSGKELGQRSYPIYNRAVGIVSVSAENAEAGEAGETTVSYLLFPGLTDPFSLAALFLGSFLIFVVVGVPGAGLFALCWTVAAALFTAISSRVAFDGQMGREHLKRFITLDGSGLAEKPDGE